MKTQALDEQISGEGQESKKKSEVKSARKKKKNKAPKRKHTKKMSGGGRTLAKLEEAVIETVNGLNNDIARNSDKIYKIGEREQDAIKLRIEEQAADDKLHDSMTNQIAVLERRLADLERLG